MNHITIVQRLGFDAYASNIVANIIEDGNLTNGYHVSDDDIILTVTLINNRHHITVRAYIDGLGWQTADLAV